MTDSSLLTSGYAGIVEAAVLLVLPVFLKVSGFAERLDLFV